MQQNSKRQKINVTTHKKTDCKYDKMQKYKNTNVTVHKKTKYKYDKIQSSTTKT